MGRPRKYFTPEAQKAANRAKSQRSYKRHNTEIASRRHQKRKNEQMKSIILIGEPTFKDSSSALEPTRDRNKDHVAYWLQRSQRVAVKLSQLTNGSPASYVNDVYKRFITSHDKDIIHEQVVRASRLTTSIHRYHDQVLQLAGAGTELEAVAVVERNVGTVTRWLEELLCTAMVDYNEVIDTYKAKRFGFQ